MKFSSTLNTSRQHVPQAPVPKSRALYSEAPSFSNDISTARPGPTKWQMNIVSINLLVLQV